LNRRGIGKGEGSLGEWVEEEDVKEVTRKLCTVYHEAAMKPGKNGAVKRSQVRLLLKGCFCKR
jgi:hypothetical protein